MSHRAQEVVRKDFFTERVIYIIVVPAEYRVSHSCRAPVGISHAALLKSEAQQAHSRVYKPSPQNIYQASFYQYLNHLQNQTANANTLPVPHQKKTHSQLVSPRRTNQRPSLAHYASTKPASVAITHPANQSPSPRRKGVM
jgi:hypothetical protein